MFTFSHAFLFFPHNTLAVVCLQAKAESASNEMRLFFAMGGQGKGFQCVQFTSLHHYALNLHSYNLSPPNSMGVQGKPSQDAVKGKMHARSAPLTTSMERLQASPSCLLFLGIHSCVGLQEVEHTLVKPVNVIMQEFQLIGKMDVSSGSLIIAMPHEDAKGLQIAAAHDVGSGESMPEQVGMHIGIDFL